LIFSNIFNNYKWNIINLFSFGFGFRFCFLSLTILFFSFLIIISKSDIFYFNSKTWSLLRFWGSLSFLLGTFTFYWGGAFCSIRFLTYFWWLIFIHLYCIFNLGWLLQFHILLLIIIKLKYNILSIFDNLFLFKIK